MTNLKLYIIAFLFIHASLFAQDKFDFETKQDYLTYTEKNFSINPNEVYFISSDLNVSNPSKRSMVYFIKNNKLATIEDVANTLSTQCNPDRMMKQITLEAIDKSLSNDPFAETFAIKSMVTGKVYTPQPDELIVVFLYTYSIGSSGQLYIKERETVIKNLGIKSFIITMDNGSIAELSKS